MGNAFGKIDLAYKYSIVFVSLLILTILAGLVKVFFDRRKLNKLAAQQNEGAESREERMELTGREKDEGDYFGVRALEAGFYAGVAQSRPTSRAGSVASPFMSTSTLVGGGGMTTPKDPMHSVNSSVTTLPVAHTKDRNHNSYRDSETLPSPQNEMPARRKTPPAIRLAPSTAELTGRHRLSDAVDMNRAVPPSPSERSDSSESDGQLSPRSTHYYSPNPPQLPMPQPEGFRASFVSVHEHYKSQTASMLMAWPASSGSNSPSHAPEVKMPTMPGITLNEEDLDAPPRSPVRLLPKTYQPTHRRDDSDSSNYSDRRQSLVEAEAKRQSTIPPLPKKNEQRKTLLPPVAIEANRYSEIFNAYYRQSIAQPAQAEGANEANGASKGTRMAL